MSQIIITEKIFARLDHPEYGDAQSIRFAEQNLFQNIMYQVEIVDWKGDKTFVALRGVVGWYTSEMFSFYMENGSPFEVETMRRKVNYKKPNIERNDDLRTTNEVLYTD